MAKINIKSDLTTNINADLPSGKSGGILATDHRGVNKDLVDSLTTQDEHDNTLYGCQYRPLASDFNGSGPYNPNTDLKVAITPSVVNTRMLVPTSADVPYAVWRWNGSAWVLYYNILFNQNTGVHTKVEVPTTVTAGKIVVMKTPAGNEKADVIEAGTITATNIQEKLSSSNSGKITVVGPTGSIIASDYDLQSIITAAQTNQSDLGIVQVTFPYTITQDDIDDHMAIITLPDKLRQYFHVHITLQGVPLSIGNISGVAKGTGSISYMENTSVVSIDFTNSTDFGETPYVVQPGWVIEVKYTKIVLASTPISYVTVTDVTGTYEPSDDSVWYTVELTNVSPTSSTEEVNVALTLVGAVELSQLITTPVTQSAPYGVSTFNTQHYKGLDPDTYTLTATLNSTSASGTATIPALTAIFQPVGDIVGERISATEIRLTQYIKNIGNAVGTFQVYLTLYNTVPTEISPTGDNRWQSFNIAPGATQTYVRTITGISNIEYNGYSKYDDTIYTYDSGNNTYTAI